MYKQILQNTSTDQITFLSDVNKKFFINKNGKSSYFEIRNFESDYFYNFINMIDKNSLYTIIPIISVHNNINKPYIVLSRSILISKYSNHKLVRECIFSKYLEGLEAFGIDDLLDDVLILKYKKVWIDIYPAK